MSESVFKVCHNVPVLVALVVAVLCRMYNVASRVRCALQYDWGFRCLCTPPSRWRVPPPKAANAPECDDPRCVRGCIFHRLDPSDLCKLVHIKRAREVTVVHGLNMYHVSDVRPVRF